MPTNPNINTNNTRCRLAALVSEEGSFAVVGLVVETLDDIGARVGDAVDVVSLDSCWSEEFSVEGKMVPLELSVSLALPSTLLASSSIFSWPYKTKSQETKVLGKFKGDRPPPQTQQLSRRDNPLNSIWAPSPNSARQSIN